MKYSTAVVFGMDDNYVEATFTAAWSLLEQSRDEAFDIVFLYDGEGTAEELCKDVRRDLSAHVTIESVPPPTRLSQAPEGTASHVTSAMFLKILAPSLLGDRYERVLCLDSDTLVTGDITDLLETDLEGECLGGVADGYAYAVLDARGYFNAGVLLIDTRAYRQQRILERSLSYLETYASQLPYPEQDTLNWVLDGHWFRLDSQWNYLLGEDRKRLPDSQQHQILAANRIVHFVGPTKPWPATYPDDRFRKAYSAVHSATHQPKS